MCSEALDVFDADGCEIVVESRSWSSEVGHPTSVRECS